MFINFDKQLNKINKNIGLIEWEYLETNNGAVNELIISCYGSDGNNIKYKSIFSFNVVDNEKIRKIKFQQYISGMFLRMIDDYLK